MVNNFAVNLRIIRKRENISQKELAKILIVTPQAVSRWENGLTTPDLDMIIKIAIALNTSIQNLVIDEDEVRNSSYSMNNKQIRVIDYLFLVLNVCIIILLITK